MAVLSTAALTLADWAKRRDPDGKVSSIANVLAQYNEIQEDLTYIECNNGTHHVTTVLTGLPTVYFRLLNQGIPASKSTTAQLQESVGLMEARSEIDLQLCKLAGDVNEFRASEDVPFMESMGQTQATTMFYGNPGVSPEQFLGLATRYSSLSAGNAKNILDAGGTGSNNTSVWLIGWSANTVFCTFPKGSNIGLTHRDLGEQTVFGTNNTRMQVLASLYNWNVGLMVRDWRYAVRVCNINVTDLLAVSATQATTAATAVVNMMTRALALIPTFAGSVRWGFYCNRTVFTGLMLQAVSRSNNALSLQDAISQFGTPQKWLYFLTVPIRKCDALLNTEARVV